LAHPLANKDCFYFFEAGRTAAYRRLDANTELIRLIRLYCKKAGGVAGTLKESAGCKLGDVIYVGAIDAVIGM